MSKYWLEEKPINRKDIFIITIIGDSNDGDYVTEKEHMTRKDFEEILPELINLRDNYSASHTLEDYDNPMDLSIPYNGWDGCCHSLKELSVEYIDENGKIWDVKF